MLDQIDRQMGDPLTLAGMGGRLPTALAEVEADGVTHPAVPYLIDTLASDNSLYSLYFGYDNGDFLQVIAARQDGRIVAAHKAPEGTWMIVRAISGQGDDRTQYWTFLDHGGTVLGTARDARPGYDPRGRGWYKPAMDSAERPVLSAPYLFNSLQQPGITASRRLPRQAGVFGVDITLADLNGFIGGQRVSANGGIVLLDEQRRVLAAGGDLLGGGLAPLAPLTQVGTPMATALTSLLDRAERDRAAFLDMAGTRVLAGVHLAGGRQPAADRGGAGALDDFTGVIRDMQRQMVLLAEWWHW